MKAVLFRSESRFDAFRTKLDAYGVRYDILDFNLLDWIEYDYQDIDILIYFPNFMFSSNHPNSLVKVHDNLMYIRQLYPRIKMFPDPNIIKYYNDKYRQFLFLKGHGYPIPDTIPLISEAVLNVADKELGYPMVIKNRYGAGGESVYQINSKRELLQFYRLSKMNFYHLGAIRFFASKLFNREFWYFLIKGKNTQFPFLSPPLLAQRFVDIERDLKTVIGKFRVVEGHWRYKGSPEMWKVNIDGGGTGVWGYIDEEAIELSERLARDLKTLWLNIDLFKTKEGFLITEFSPVWHHYRYMEKPSFIYKEDYNIQLPLEISLDLERIIVESLIESAKG